MTLQELKKRFDPLDHDEILAGDCKSLCKVAIKNNFSVYGFIKLSESFIGGNCEEIQVIDNKTGELFNLIVV